MDIQVLEILKWVGIVLVAGFIGYFGRYLAMLIIERMHKKPQSTVSVEPAKEASGTQVKMPEEINLKLEKKKVKAEAKRAKKEQKK